MTFSDILIQDNPTLAAILYPMLIGLIIGATVVLFNKQVIGKLVKKLLDDKIHSEGSAKTLDELGFGKSRMLKFLLRDGTTLRKVVKTAEGGEAGAAAKVLHPAGLRIPGRGDLQSRRLVGDHRCNCHRYVHCADIYHDDGHSRPDTDAEKRNQRSEILNSSLF